MRKMPLVLIEWDDIVSDDNSWKTEDETLELVGEVAKAVSVGFVLKRTKKTITIVPNFVLDGDISGATTIPFGVITRIVGLKEDLVWNNKGDF